MTSPYHRAPRAPRRAPSTSRAIAEHARVSTLERVAATHSRRRPPGAVTLRGVLPSKGTRRIVVDGETFAWRARHQTLPSDEPGRTRDVATIVVEHVRRKGVACSVVLDAAEIGVLGWGIKAAEMLPVSPRIVRQVVLDARRAGCFHWEAGVHAIEASRALYDILRDHPHLGKTGRLGGPPGRHQR